MTLTLAITINVLLDVAIVGLLAFVMSRAGNLTAHLADAPQAPSTPAGPTPRPRARRRVERGAPRRDPVLD